MFKIGEILTVPHSMTDKYRVAAVQPDGTYTVEWYNRYTRKWEKLSLNYKERLFIRAKISNRERIKERKKCLKPETR